MLINTFANKLSLGTYVVRKLLISMFLINIFFLVPANIFGSFVHRFGFIENPLTLGVL